MYRREPTADQVAKQQQFVAESAQRMAQHQAELEAAAQQRAAKGAAEEAETQRLLDARKNGNTFDPKEQPDFFKLNLEKRALEAAELEAAEAARLAAVTPRQAIISALSHEQQKRIATYERVNKRPFPLEALGIVVPVQGV